MSLLRQGKAQVLTIYLGESDRWQGMPLYTAIVQFLRAQDCAGATVTRAIAGYGAGARLHESGTWRLSSDAPVIIQVVDQPARLRRLLPHLQEMLNGGLMTLHETDVLKYTHARRRGLPTKLPVRQVMETSLLTVRPDTPIARIINLLLEAPFRALPVVDAQERLQGIISTGDLITAGVLPMRRGMVRAARELDSPAVEAIEAPLEEARQSTRTAQEVMNRQVTTVRPEQTIREAARLMLDTGLRRLPVVEPDGRLIGMLSRADLLQVVTTSPLMSPQASSGTQPLRPNELPASTPLQEQPIADFVNTEVTTVREQTSFTEVIDALILSPLKRVIVINDQEHVQGIISDVDVLASIQGSGQTAHSGLLALLTGRARGKPGKVPTGILQTPAGKVRVAADIMNREVVTVAETAPVQAAIEQMIRTRRKVLPVVDRQGRLLGTVGRSDLLRILVEDYRDP